MRGPKTPLGKSTLDESTLPFASISELNAALRSRQISCVELTRFFGQRLETLGPVYNALACSLLKEGHKAAKDVDGDIKRERFRGPLQGVPYAVKDLFAVAGYPTTWGTKLYAKQVFDYNATVVDRLDGRGGILIGKLAMIQLAGGGGYSSASASLHGPALNPWNKLYWAGGSSSGSGAAVAAGLTPYALGSETSGSILTPASYCGISGLRPTYGLVSRHGAMALSWTMDKVGVLARSAEDCGLVLQVISGGGGEDAASAQTRYYYGPQYYGELKEQRIGYAEIDFSDWPDAALRPVFAAALATIKSTGAKMVETKLPDFPYGPIISCIIDSEAASIFEPLIRSNDIGQLGDPIQIEGLKAALNYSATDYLKAMRVRSQIQEAFGGLFANVDLLVAPTNLKPPDRADRPFDDTEPKGPEQKGVAADLVRASNLCGLPALTIPCGYADGLPVGLQIVGRPFSENRILALGKEFQQRTDFHKQHPVVSG
ncbi:MAG TPA: amidase [Bryobacteraceae bacterium]|nr:amidase [Bryobacteraceae bacterium]